MVRKSPPRLALPLALRPGNGWFPLKRSRYARGRTHPDKNKDDDSHEIPLPRGRGSAKSKGGEKSKKWLQNTRAIHPASRFGKTTRNIRKECRTNRNGEKKSLERTREQRRLGESDGGEREEEAVV